MLAALCFVAGAPIAPPGANVSAAAQLLRGDLAGGTIACMICDSGLKYLSTDLWQPADVVEP